MSPVKGLRRHCIRRVTGSASTSEGPNERVVMSRYLGRRGALTGWGNTPDINMVRASSDGPKHGKGA